MAALSTVDKVVFFGRYTTFAGATSFPTVPISVVDYDSLETEFWRGPSADVNDVYTLKVEGSTDQTNWTDLATDTILASLGSGTAPTNYPWLRVTVVVQAGGAAHPTATGYVVGRLIRRQARKPL